jgi:hypothetical protein
MVSESEDGIIKQISQIRVIKKEDVEDVEDIEDIESVVTKTSIMKCVETECGQFKKLDSFPNVKEVLEEEKERNKSSDIIILDRRKKSELTWSHFQGSHYFCKPMLKGKKELSEMSKKLYKIMIHFLSQNDSFFYVRYYTQWGERLGAMYAEQFMIDAEGSTSLILKISILYPNKVILMSDYNSNSFRIKKDIFDQFNAKLLKKYPDHDTKSDDDVLEVSYEYDLYELITQFVDLKTVKKTVVKAEKKEEAVDEELTKLLGSLG